MVSVGTQIWAPFPGPCPRGDGSKTSVIYVDLTQHEVTDGPMYNPWIQADSLCRDFYKALLSGLTWPSM